MHIYQGVDKGDRAWEKVKSWFGYKLHLVVDAHFELPLAFQVTKVKDSEVVVGRGLLERLGQEHPVVW